MKNTFKFTPANGNLIEVYPPKMKIYRQFNQLENDCELINWISECTDMSSDDILNKFTADDISSFTANYLDWICRTKQENQNLNLPHYSGAAENKVFFETNFVEAKIISDYANCSFSEVWEMDVFTYWAILHDAVVHNLNQTEEGRQYLESAYCEMQTEPDREALRAAFGGGDNNG